MALERLVDRLEWAVERVSYWLAQLAAASTLLLTAVVTFGIVMRFVFNSSQNWTDELASYCLLWMGYFGLTYALNTGAHIRIDFFIDRMSPAMRRYVEITIWALGVVFAALLFLGCLSAVVNFIRRGTYRTAGLDIALFWPAIPMVLGSGLFTLAMLARMLRLALMGERVVQKQDNGVKQ